MTEEYGNVTWDCTDDILEVIEEIGKVAANILLGEFVLETAHASTEDIERILRDFAQRNVEAALKLADRG